MQTQGFHLQENYPTGMQIITSAKVVFQHSTSVGRKDGHMEQVLNPYAPPQTAITFYQYLIDSFFLKMCWFKNNYTILSFSWIFQPSVNSVIPQKLGDGWIILISIITL